MPYGLPDSTIVNRSVPKKMFTDKLGANTRMKKHFTDDIESIRWLAKLAPSTLNANDGKQVHEISVFLMPLKLLDCPDDLFAFIDNMLPRHTLFILEYGGQACLHINYKEAITGNSNKQYRIVKTFRSPWLTTDEVNVVIDSRSMDGIYESLVRQVAGDNIISDDRNLQEAVAKTDEFQALQKTIAALENKMRKECQPTKKFELHQQLTKLKAELKSKQITLNTK